MNTVAFIFARGGSKGLPDKNIKLFSGRPLIAHTIINAIVLSHYHVHHHCEIIKQKTK